MNILKYTSTCFLELLFPRTCIVCNKKLFDSENYLCLKCLLQLPRLNLHGQEGNRMEQLFYGRVPIEKAAAYFEFRKGSNYQKVIHHLKYKGQKGIGEFMGERFGAELKTSDYLSNADIVCPVPLHPKREKQRGYNQSYHIAVGLARQLEKPLNTSNLKRKIFTNTQTRKSRIERWQNVDGIFDISSSSEFEGKHIILVDDVVTTGATIEACSQAILKKCNAKISVLSLAIA